MILEIIILLLGIPLGFLISFFCKEELVSGRKWFKLIIISFTIISVLFIILEDYLIFLTSFFIIITILILYKKSFNKKFIRNN